MNKDALAARLRATFLEELGEQVRVMNADLLALEATPQDGERLRSLFRVVHTLKGAARAAGIPPIERVCHVLEARLADARDGRTVLTADDFALLFATADALADAGVKVKAGDGLEHSPLAQIEAKLMGVVQPAAPSTPRAAPAPPAAPPASAPEPTVRVAPERLDALLATSGQLAIVDSRLTSRPGEVEALHGFAAAWAAEWRRTRRKLQLVLERAQVPDALASLASVDENLRRLVQDTDRLAAGVADDTRLLAQVTAHMADQVRRVRLRPFSEACEALPRAVRDLSVAAGKLVELEVDGGDVEVDRAVLDGLREGLLHLVRNAVDHGIEPPAERERLGKPRTGRVRITAALRGERVIVTVADDGAGIDEATIRERLRQRGGPAPADPAELGRLLLQGGVSARAEASAISGRGVGLDIVRAAAERIHGRLEVHWTPGTGTTFTLTCPPSLVTLRALLAAVGSQTVAFPAAAVDRVRRLPAAELRHAGGQDVIADGGETVPVVSLARLLGPLFGDDGTGASLIVVLLAGAGGRLGVVVDAVLGDRELVLRPVRRARTPLPLLSGAALLGTGRIALVLDPGAVVAAGRAGGSALAPVRPSAREAAAPVRRRILVVDDSITSRTLEQSILEAAGYDVVTAVDGAQGWKVIQEQGCDLVVADVEMPRMDGFALCEAVRGSRTHAELPVILVTGLESPEHRARGLEVGADAYLAKSSFDQQTLLETIHQLLD